MSQLIEVGQPIPEFLLPATGNQNLGPQVFKGQIVILYFYPRDNTPGCTQEAEEFRDNYTLFQNHQVVILGISRDSVRTHENFKAKYLLPFDLLSDKEEKVCQLFHVMKDKIMYGKPARGIERSTFLIDKEGIIQAIWRKVSVKGHVAEVLAKVEELENA